MGSGYRQDLIEVVADQAIGKSLAARKWYVMAKRSWQTKSKHKFTLQSH